MAESGARRLWPLAALSGLLLGLVWLHVQATLLGYKAAAARDADEKIRAHNAYLRLEIERFESPSQLEKEARRRLGMQSPDPRQMIVLEAGEPERPPVRAQRGPVQLASALLKRFGAL
jgi:cell division protein FtsL